LQKDLEGDCQQTLQSGDAFNDQPFALGKARPFPDGSEAVMIDSTLAHDTFLEMVNQCKGSP